VKSIRQNTSAQQASDFVWKVVFPSPVFAASIPTLFGGRGNVRGYTAFFPATARTYAFRQAVTGDPVYWRPRSGIGIRGAAQVHGKDDSDTMERQEGTADRE
jgi:hypothetical protein